MRAFILGVTAVFTFTPSTQGAGSCASSGGTTALASAAKGLDAGEWCELSTTYQGGFAAVFNCETEGGGSIPSCLTYHDSMEWDPRQNEIHFIGGAHGPNLQAEVKHMTYTEDTNTWIGNHDTPYSLGGHTYDHNAIDPATGIFYHRRLETIYRWLEGSWLTPLTTPDTPGSRGGIEWFPESQSIVFLDGRGRMHEWFKSGGWKTVTSNLEFDQKYQVGIEYNPVHKVMWMYDGAGTRNYKYGPSDEFPIELPRSPVFLNTAQANVTVDTVSGEYIVYSISTDSWRTFDINSRTWATISHNMPPFSGNNGGGTVLCSEASIPEYGVNMYVCWRDQATYIYKHSPSGPNPPPGAPTNLEVL